MLTCAKPFRGQHGCGQCMPCRIRRGREWTHRIMLEAKLHSDNCFVTLTYAPENEPAGRSLDPTHYQKFLKSLRKAFAPSSLRYFFVGEYGELNERPHFHAILFGYPNCVYGRSRYRDGVRDCCPNCDRIRDLWRKGFVELGSVTDESARYVCGYVTKKMTSSDDQRLAGRYPEFARMSLKPGIGAGATTSILESLDSATEQWFDSNVDVPYVLKHGSKNMPLGRYLRNRLRSEYVPDLSEEAAQLWKDARSLTYSREKNETLLAMRTAYVKRKGTSQGFEDYLTAVRRQKVMNVESRAKIFKPKGKL